MTAVVLLGQGGAGVARALSDALDGARLHGLAGRIEGADVAFEDTARHLRGLFMAGEAIVGVCAAGILIRALAPVLGGKAGEPPVVAVAEDGSVVVPLLGGHRGGNRLAGDIGALLGVAAAVTTAGDLRFRVALDDPPAGWRLANGVDAKPFMAALLAGAGVRLTGDAPWLAGSGLPFDDDGALEIVVTHEATEGGPERLVYHPAVLALGVGCERDAEPGELAALVADTMADAGLAPEAVAGVFSIDLKSDELAVLVLAADLAVPARFFDAAALDAETPRLANPSDVVFAEVGCHGVAEGAALAAAGAGGTLIAGKRKSKRATCAVALAAAPIDAAASGRGRGSLAVIGTGPGGAHWRAPEADARVRAATDLVGYGLYLDLLGDAARHKKRHEFALGEEEARVRHALDLAAMGRDVALVSSGDPGIYAMASLVFELLDRGGRPDWARVDISVTPGISALQACAARAGAPLGHDFCTISLSDLLTPWPVIEGRIEAAGQGDFVIAFYNPVSKRRTTQLARARRILLRHRPADTPVVLGRNLGRETEQLRIVTLDALAPAEVDMLTVVIVGSSETRLTPGGRVYTPRGYGDKVP